MLEGVDERAETRHGVYRRAWRRRAEREHPPRARAFLVHGTHEHSAEYRELATALAAKDVVVFALDLRGHGRSEGARGDLGSLDVAVRDLVTLVREESCTPLPTLLFGHSLGSLIALLAAHEIATARPPSSLRVDAVVLSGFAMDSLSPPFGVRALMPLLQAVPSTLHALCRVLAAVAPSAPACPMPPKVVLTHDHQKVRAAIDDPLRYQGWIGNRTALCLLDGRAACRRILHEWAAEFPFLLVHGAEDVVCPLSACHALLAASPQRDKELRVYGGLYHEVLNETPTERARVIRDVVGWAETRLFPRTLRARL